MGSLASVLGTFPPKWEAKHNPGHLLPQSVIFLRLLFFTNERQAPLRAEDEYLHA
jgi:hypothetical protein